MQPRTGVLALAGLVALAAQPVAAQEPADARWQAFAGCWAPITEDGAEPVAEHIVCFSPTAAGVNTLTVVGGAVTSEERILADGSARPVKDEQCEGTETARWSEDGARVYLRSSLKCGEAVLGRESAGVLALAGPNSFLDVQAVGVEDQYGVRVLRYRALASTEYPASLSHLATAADPASRLYAAAPLALEDIVEANGTLPAPAMQALLVNLPTTKLRIDADALIALADAGLEPDVIDVLVALAYPEKFAVAEAPRTVDERAHSRREWMYYDPWRRYDRYDRYGYDPYYYSPFGYGRYGWGYGTGTVIIVERDDLVDENAPTRGTLVKGRGYTRPARSSDSGSSSSRPARPAVERSDSPAPSSGASSRSSGSSSSGSSSSTSERRAKPRPPDSN